MRYLPTLLPYPGVLDMIHPSLKACIPDDQGQGERVKKPSEGLWEVRVDPTLVADDWKAFLILWHVFWPGLVLRRWWEGRRWTRVSVRFDTRWDKS
jgi:hypothetical protein